MPIAMNGFVHSFYIYDAVWNKVCHFWKYVGSQVHYSTICQSKMKAKDYTAFSDKNGTISYINNV